jgi:hypothetical protein
MVIIYVRDWLSAAVVASVGFLMSYMLAEMCISIYGIPRPLDTFLATVFVFGCAWLFDSVLILQLRSFYKAPGPARSVTAAQRLDSNVRRTKWVLVRGGRTVGVQRGRRH